ncbi:2843_t:CDS:1, partial [Scutellospora calospora]
ILIEEMSSQESNKGSSNGSSDPYSTGTNSQGNHWCHRGPSEAMGGNYHYSNRDSSYYYQNPDGSTYYNNGQGGAVYTPPSQNPRANN